MNHSLNKVPDKSRDMDGMALNAPELMRRASAGDRDAFGALYTQYLTPVYRYIFFRVKNSQDADDLTQTVFLKAFDAVERFHLKAASPLAYLYTVARNIVIDYWRKKKDIPHSDVEGILETVSDGKKGPDDVTELNFDMEKVRAAMQHLTEEQQEVISLRFFSDYSNEQIAAQMKKTPAAIRQLQCRALKVLREQLATI